MSEWFTEFVDHWSLFGDAYLSGLLLALVLPLLGTIVVARKQIFIGAAVAQSAAFGIACALVMEDTLEPGSVGMWGIVAAVLAAVFCRNGSSRISNEARSGWIYLSAASFSGVVLSRSPIGREEVARLLSSTLLGATADEVRLISAIAALTLGAFCYMRREVVLFLLDPDYARAIGLPVDRMELLASVWLGFVIGISVKFAGLLFTFGLLLLPTMCLTNLVGNVTAVVVGAPAVGVFAVALSYLCADRWDLPPGQMVTALLSLSVIPGASFAALRRRTRFDV